MSKDGMPQIKLEKRRNKGKNGGLKGNWKFALRILLIAKLLAAFASAAPFGEFQTVAMDGAAGSLSESNGVFHLSGTSTNKGIIFACQSFSGNGEISARINRATKLSKVGLLFRQNTNSESSSAGMFFAPANTVFERKLAAGQPSIVTTRTNETWEWLRVVREGSSFSGFYSADGKGWTQISADTIDMSESVFVGLAISGEGEADIKSLRLASAKLVSPSAKENLIAPTNMVVEATAETLGGKIERVEFFSGAEKIQEIQTAPYRFVWTNVLAGTHSITAKIVVDSGSEFFTEPVNCEVKLRPPIAKFLGMDAKTKGNWKGAFGADGFLIVNDKTNFPSGIQLVPENILPFTWPDTANTEHRALQRAEFPGRIVSSWNHRRPIVLNLSLADGSERRVSLYFLDCDKKERVMDVQICNDAGKVLNQQTIGSFIEGKYLTWILCGKVVIKISSIGPSNPIVSALFFDPAQ